MSIEDTASAPFAALLEAVSQCHGDRLEAPIKPLESKPKMSGQIEPERPPSLVTKATVTPAFIPTSCKPVLARVVRYKNYADNSEHKGESVLSPRDGDLKYESLSPSNSPQTSPQSYKSDDDSSVTSNDEIFHQSASGPSPCVVRPGRTNHGTAPSKRCSAKKRGSLSREAIDIMKEWMFEHFEHPYPNEEEKVTISSANRNTRIYWLSAQRWGGVHLIFSLFLSFA